MKLKLKDKLKEEIVLFISKLTSGLGKVDTHFIADIVNGIVLYYLILLEAQVLVELKKVLSVLKAI